MSKYISKTKSATTRSCVKSPMRFAGSTDYRCWKTASFTARARKRNIGFTRPELLRYISKQQERGSGNVVQYEVEYHKRIASCFASFILTIIGVSLSSRKRKGGMGVYLGTGLALSFSYILLQTVCATFAINANTPPMLAAWIPNILYAGIAYLCYRKAPN